ncbi:hypothetical protein R6Y90_19700 [Alteromonas macleodii]|uniref:hypothetical protein n=1 Tax=Alteromonas macleodii TaxID=28108 RepID=UPI002982849A|nr:hypothetical protein [Alteromonas macleodii]MDW5287166.1 hypothetical protein [Alteromonas macleodii]
MISTWKNKTFFSDILINIIAIFFLFFPLVFLFFTSSTIESWLTLVSFYASGFILNIESLSESKQLIFINGDISQEEKEREKRRVMFLAVGILTPLLMSKVTSSNLLKSTFTNLGVRAENATLLVSKNNRKNLTNLSESQKIAIFTCQSNEYSTLQNITVDWHGIGSVTQIRLPSNDSDDLVIQLESAGVKVVKGLGDRSESRCFLLKNSIYFESGEFTPNDVGNRKLKEIITDIKEILNDEKSKLKLKKISLSGYTDIQPVKRKDLTNYELAKQRIKTVKSKLQTQLGINIDFESSPLGIYKANKTNNSYCTSKQYEQYEKACLYNDRLVEITVSFVIGK